MTENKRFVSNFDKEHCLIFQDLEKEEEYEIGFTNSDEDLILNLLNELNDEKEQLKSERRDLISVNKDYRNKLSKLEKENEQLKKDIEILNESEDISIETNIELSNQIRDLKKELSQFRNISTDYNIPYDKLTDAFEDSISENEQLKSENEDLKTYKEAVSDILISWSQKNLTAKQLSIVIAIMEELDVEVDKK